MSWSTPQRDGLCPLAQHQHQHHTPTASIGAFTCRSLSSRLHGLSSATAFAPIQVPQERWKGKRRLCPPLKAGVTLEALEAGISSLAQPKMSLATLGQDILCFLASTVVIIPVFKQLRISPVLGFLACGLVLKQLGLANDLEDLERLSELGVLFLLFEMGLELSLDRLKALAKYAFGLGTLQMIACTSAFSLFALPVGNGLGTFILEKVASATPNLVSIRTVDEAVVIGGALAMSSSAFVLQLLTERGEMPTRAGSATLGILLLQVGPKSWST